jgi:hypothetical protein
MQAIAEIQSFLHALRQPVFASQSQRVVRIIKLQRIALGSKHAPS